MAQTAAQKKRSAAAKKAAETRKKKAEAAEQAQNGDDQQSLAETDEARQGDAVEPYVPSHRPLQNAGLDQAAAEEKRQAELAEEREVHNRRTGDASLA